MFIRSITQSIIYIEWRLSRTSEMNRTKRFQYVHLSRRSLINNSKDFKHMNLLSWCLLMGDHLIRWNCRSICESEQIIKLFKTYISASKVRLFGFYLKNHICQRHMPTGSTIHLFDCPWAVLSVNCIHPCLEFVSLLTFHQQIWVHKCVYKVFEIYSA